MYIGKKLKEVLKQKNISLADLSDKSGIDRRECASFLENRREPTLEIFVQIVNALDVLPSELLGMEGGEAEELLAIQRKIKELPPEKQKELFEEIKIFLP